MNRNELFELAEKNELSGFVEIENDSDYHNGPGVSKSELDKIDISPAHYKHYKENPPEQTKAMALGSAVHTAILEPDKFSTIYTVKPWLMVCQACETDWLDPVGDSTACPKCESEQIERKTLSMATKAGKAWRATSCGQILDRAEYDKILAMQDAILNGPFSKLLTGGRAEVAMYAKCKHTDLLKRGKADYVNTEAGVIVDVKTTKDAGVDGFGRSIEKFRYNVQAAYYLDLASQITGREFSDFVFLCVESTEPYVTACYRLHDDAVSCGRQDYRENLATLKRCIDADRWPGYPEEI